ncbi:hypothetical protein Sjap_015153 [Stephania japonica]|uniref:Uncharacterized protein n=1 Tax=Stephania japonica TaxID=461633 RepID=A0AAP0IK66_9MAGN
MLKVTHVVSHKKLDCIFSDHRINLEIRNAHKISTTHINANLMSGNATIYMQKFREKAE